MKKRNIIAIAALTAFAFALSACAGSPKAKGPESEIIINAFDRDVFSVVITNENGKKVFSNSIKMERTDSGHKGTITIPLANGKYTVECTGGKYITAKQAVDLNFSQVTIEARYRSSLLKVEIAVTNTKPTAAAANQKAGNLVAALETAVPKAFTDINTALPANLPPNATIAVFPITSSGAELGEFALVSLTDQFIEAGYDVVEKRKVEELLAEYDFQKSGLVGEKTLGELLGADAVVFSILTDEGQLNSWAVDSSKRTTLGKSTVIPTALAAQDSLTVKYPAFPPTRDPNQPENRIPIDEYKVMLKAWTNELVAFMNANPLVEFPPEPVSSMFAGSYYVAGRGTVYYSDGSYALDEVQKAWMEASRQVASGKPPVRLLPFVSGGSNNEAATIAEFLSFGKNTSGVTSAAVQQIGRKNMLVLATRPAGRGKPTLRFVDYADTLELWVKLQTPPPRERTTRAVVSNANIWSQYGAGVDRADAEMLTGLLITDTLSIPYQSVVLRSFVDATADYEAGLKELPDTARVNDVNITNPGALALQWREYIKTPRYLAADPMANANARYGMTALAEYTKTAIGHHYVYHFDWSRRGSRTRLEVGKTYQNPLVNNNRRYYWRYSIEFGSTQEFLTKMRGLSLFMLERLSSPNEEILGLQGYDLSTAVAPAPVPANFVELKRISSPQGGAPMGGFYIASAPVSQREYESLMKQNPSFVKNPAQPINNVSVIDAMIYCNQMSIRDGLEPAYLIEYDAKDRSWTTGLNYHEINSVTIDRFASGYRLATAEEWRYARGQVDGMGVQAEYIYGGSWNQVKGKGFGIKDDAARIMFADEEKSEDWRIRNIPINAGSAEDTYYHARDVLSHEEDLGIEGTQRKVRVAPVIRVVRPIFDYWKYTSGQ
jgi:hypothetical protein